MTTFHQQPASVLVIDTLRKICEQALNTPHHNLLKQINWLYSNIITDDGTLQPVTVVLPAVGPQQQSGNNCGLFAVAFATEILAAMQRGDSSQDFHSALGNIQFDEYRLKAHFDTWIQPSLRMMAVFPRQR